MQPLEKSLRNRLERTIKDARDTAEAAASASLEQLGVGEAAPFAHLSADERELRRKLRVHGRQLGDSLNGGKVQTMDRLVEEVAYEHWHRMLFARFLAENNLLMYDGVAVTLEECAELAVDEGLRNEWELAARLATAMLPQIFRPEAVVFSLHFPPEHQQRLERLVAELPSEVFSASDSLGWVYQFWQAKRKEAVNASEVKIGARELPAVTQLFTEPYMVAFLLDNSLGAWWVAKLADLKDGKELRPGARQILRDAGTEEELRTFFSLPGVPLEYLRFVKQDDGEWRPAAGTFAGWPGSLAELKTLDPCCGSGHFLVAAFLMLVAMRRELENLSAREAVDAVLRDNIHGLELDQRCVELAAFALALTAWRYPNLPSPSGRGVGGEGPIGYRPLPELHLACSGLSVSVAKEEWKQLALDKHNLRLALDWMYDAFKDAPVLGSLLNPARTDAARLVEWPELSAALEQALNREQTAEQQEAAVVAQGLTKAASLLAGKYHWVITNVPYLARGKQEERLRDFCEKHYPAAKNDLATVFLERCLELCIKGGTASIVLPQNWLFLTSYRKFREQLLKQETWHLIARLGPGAFETISGEVVKAILITLSRGNALTPDFIPPGGGLSRRADEGLIRGLDVSEPRTAADKAAGLLTSEIKQVEQAKQLENPDARVTFEERNNTSLLSRYADSYWGLGSGDGLRFCRKFFEIPLVNDEWEFLHITFSKTMPHTGMQEVVFWQNGCGELYEMAEAAKKKLKNIWQRGKEAWNKKGIAVSQMGSLPRCLYEGQIFQNGVATIIPKKDEFYKPIFTFCMSDEYVEEVRRIDQKLSVTNLTLIKVPFDLDHWTKVAAEKYPNGLPKPYSDDPSQWIFHGQPAQSDEPLQVAVARLLGYRWPAELDTAMELSLEARAWVQKSADLLPLADDDGIVCIPPVRGEMSACDRLENLLAAAYGPEWSAAKKSELLAQADHGGKTLETWLREKFFPQHCKLFQHRPFIWQIWDGLRDGFAALINYHKLDHKLLETLIYTYLGDWISRQKQDQATGVDGAQEKLAAAESLKKKLELILEGEGYPDRVNPEKSYGYDIFVRWKPLEKQPIGWNPDLNDGVRLNIRPFLSVPDVAKKGAGILRDKPNIKWEKDRGKDVESAPWYHLFGGDRINDHHLSLDEKRAARDGAE
jgi:hypothetical protein